jgi:hypothetical protein
MIQKYGLSIDDAANRLFIKEFAVLDKTPHYGEKKNISDGKYVVICEVSYDCSVIRKAIDEGTQAIITELRSKDFFPIRPCVDIIIENITDLLERESNSSIDIFFDDRSLISDVYGVNEVV